MQKMKDVEDDSAKNGGQNIKTISHYKILEKLGEGGSPRETKRAGLSIDLCWHILGILKNLNGSIISRGKWASRIL